MTRRRLYNTLLVLLTLIATIVLLKLVWAIAAPFTNILLVFSMAWLVAFILRPIATAMSQGKLAHWLVNAVQKRWGKLHADRVNRLLDPLAVTLVYLTLLALLMIALLAIIPAIFQETRQLRMNLTQYIDLASNWTTALQQDLTIWLNLPPDMLSQFYRPQDINRQITAVIEEMPRVIFGLVRDTASGIGEALLTLAVSYYLMLDGSRLARQIYEVTPKRFYDEYDLAVSTISRTFGGFLRGQLVMAVLSGVVTAIAAGIAGLRYGAIIGAVAGLVIFVPVIGAPIAMFLPSVIALIQGTSLLAALLLLAFLTAFQQVLLHLVVPRIMSESIGMPPVLIILSVLIAVRLWGVAGFIFGIPVAGAIYSVGLVMLGRLKREQDLLDEAHSQDNLLND
jgi:predicted PurR-regulated permease PerM